MPDKKTIAVYLEDLDIEIVQDEQALDGSNFSAALRKIIREWSRVNNTKTVIIGGEPAEEK